MPGIIDQPVAIVRSIGEEVEQRERFLRSRLNTGAKIVMVNRWNIIVLLLVSSVGCARWEFSLLREHWDGELKGIAKAAMRENVAGDSRLCEHDYAQGWTQGYESILRGGNGEPPLIPPTEYMDPFSRRPSQADRVNVWRDGFIAGVAVAHERGVSGYARLPGGLPRDPASLQSPFYCRDTVEFSSPPSTRTVLPSPLPAVLKDETNDAKKSKPLGSEPSTSKPMDKHKSLDNDDLLSPIDKPDKARPEKLPSPKAKTPTANSLDDDSVMNSFQRLDQAAAVAKQSGWIVPLPPVRQDRIAETNSEGLLSALPKR